PEGWSAPPLASPGGPGPRAGRALRRAYERAWVALEVLLGGEPLWERFRAAGLVNDPGPFRLALAALGAGQLADQGPEGQDFPRRCCAALQAARREAAASGASLATGEFLSNLPTRARPDDDPESGDEAGALADLVAGEEREGRSGLRELLLGL